MAWFDATHDHHQKAHQWSLALHIEKAKDWMFVHGRLVGLFYRRYEHKLEC